MLPFTIHTFLVTFHSYIASHFLWTYRHFHTFRFMWLWRHRDVWPVDSSKMWARGNLFPLLFDESLHARIFKTDGFNWREGYICGAHWNSEGWKSPEDIPDILLPVDQCELLKVTYERANKIYTAVRRPTDKQVQRYKKIKCCLAMEVGSWI